MKRLGSYHEIAEVLLCDRLPEKLGDRWATPADLWSWINAIFGPFTIDVAAEPRTAKCQRFLTRYEDALVHPWGSPVDRWFLNPPFSDIGPWVERAEAELARVGGPLFGLLVLPGGRTDREWYRRLRSREALGGCKIVEVPFRVFFDAPEGKTESSNREPTIVVPMWALPSRWRAEAGVAA